MKDKKSIEQQVAELTQEQQDKLFKIGKTAFAFQLIGGIPWLILLMLGLWVIISPPIGFDYADYNKLYIGFMTWAVIGVVYILGILAVVKIKCPYYSDERWKFINKKRKANKI